MDGWEQYISLETPAGRFLAAEPDGFVRADVKVVSFWELFTMDTHGDGRVSFRSFHGRYLTAEPYGSLRSLGWTAGDHQKFRLVFAKDGTVALQCFDGRYVTATTACESEVAQVSGTCYEKDTAYSPLDMPGEGQTREDEASSCQARCHATRGCAHFTYFVVGGYCHLTHDHALRMLGSLGAISGPHTCQGSDFIMKDVWTQHGGLMPQGSLGAGGLLVLLLAFFTCSALTVHRRCRGATDIRGCNRLFRRYASDKVVSPCCHPADQEVTSALMGCDSS